jgi:acyl-coenzyme A thioesterase PaaI-like protein
MLKKLLERIKKKPWYMRFLLNTYPPYLGAGVKTVYVSPDFRKVEVKLPLRWYNRNYVGTHFGGNLYTMVDPFFMLMLIRNLGPQYIVWDQSAEIKFFKPGTGTVTAKFEITEQELEEIRQRVKEEKVYRPIFTVNILNENGEVVAVVKKVLYVRLKQ